MSIYDTEDIAEWEDKQMKTWQVEPIETIKVDKHGIEENTWKGYGVSKILDPVNYCFLCRDEEAAKDLCEFLNEECNIDDTSVEDFVIDNCIEYNNLISELSKKELKLLVLKRDFNKKEYEILTTFNFKKEFGKDNDKIRKGYIREQYKDTLEKIEDLELSIDYLKRRISYLKQLVPVKTALLEAKTHE